jgi:hypothetical protein
VNAVLALLRHISYVLLLGLISGYGVQVRRPVASHIEAWHLRSVGTILKGRRLLMPLDCRDTMLASGVRHDFRAFLGCKSTLCRCIEFDIR